MLFGQPMIPTKALLAKPTVPHDPLCGFITVDGIPTGIRRGEVLVRGRRGGKGRRGDDDLGLTLLLSGPVT